MCMGGGGPTRPAVMKYESKNDPVVITGKDTTIKELSLYYMLVYR